MLLKEGRDEATRLEGRETDPRVDRLLGRIVHQDTREAMIKLRVALETSEGRSQSIHLTRQPSRRTWRFRTEMASSQFSSKTQYSTTLS